MYVYNVHRNLDAEVLPEYPRLSRRMLFTEYEGYGPYRTFYKPDRTGQGEKGSGKQASGWEKTQAWLNYGVTK